MKTNTKSISFIDAINRYKGKELPKDFCLSICRGDVGFLFGPPKSGKTIISENLALCLASGKDSFLGFPINIPNCKVFSVSMEEPIEVRMIRRGRKQISYFNKTEIEKISKNLSYSDEGFTESIRNQSDWLVLKRSIKKLKPDIVIIDSVNRFSVDIEKRDKVNPIMEKFRTIAKKYNCAIILIHHSNKSFGNKPIDMHSMSGSSALARNAEFFIGVNKIGNKKYLKLIVNRFSKNEGLCKTFEISDDLIIKNFNEINEYELFKDIDGRYHQDSRDILFNCIQENLNTKGCIEVSTLTKILVNKEGGFSKKTLFNSLKSLIKDEEIKKVKHGVYKIKTNKRNV
ncbi:MAG: AAA family ATPase [Flavobacteriales bacterium]|nr:AAA family ATPase [Flavobacteriales bacterium]MCW8913749.1 AAA family ATPase [Flavobacteriales bacterium]MCW8938469.1 AAA family ATPase [Flavobacteriales bacterium]MCW8967762.1 AAA family ATPase [Flavobacteriales bacterium]MCW8989955.1 AAA family ATPase [Flavobacteriales bacterium]